jgi:hypothetical protein
MGLSVASIYHPTGIRWRPPKTTTSKPFYDYVPVEAERVPEPSYNNHAIDRYDPFVYHEDNRRQKTNNRPKKQNIRPQKPQLYHQPRPNHYMDSRFEVFGNTEPKIQPNFPYRDSLTWRDKRRPSAPEPAAFVQRRHPVNRRTGYSGYDYNGGAGNYREQQPVRNRYFPATSSSYFNSPSEADRYTDHQDHHKPIQDEPKRHYYFPVQDNFDDRIDNSDNDKFVGEEQLVNAGYMVQESENPNDDLVSTYDDRYRWNWDPWRAAGRS